MKNITKEELAEKVESHRAWLANPSDGERLVLVDYNLRGSNLRESDLSWSDLSRSDLRESDLSGSDLSWSDLSRSDLRESDLSGSDLSRSNLSGSDLSWSNLRESVLDNTRTCRIQGQPWEIIVYPESLAIGCERHTLEEWECFSDERIDKMDEGALIWWRIWKDAILSCAHAVRCAP